jgi:hypothetical protein
MQNKIGLGLSARSEVPGYMGYIPGAKAENMYGTTYANIVQESRELTVSGQQLPAHLHYLTMNQGNSQRIRDKLRGREEDPQGKFWKDEDNLNILRVERARHQEQLAQRLKDKARAAPVFDMTLEQAYQAF